MNAMEINYDWSYLSRFFVGVEGFQQSIQIVGNKIIASILLDPYILGNGGYSFYVIDSFLELFEQELKQFHVESFSQPLKKLLKVLNEVGMLSC